jgi:mannose-6-phosphate isomerase-like protein (cupin superfamily)
MTGIRFIPAETVDFKKNEEYVGEYLDAEALAKMTDDELRAASSGIYCADGELKLYELRLEPNATLQTHAHVQGDEIFYVIEGEMIFDSTVCRAGTAVYIPGQTFYGFSSGPAGCRALNFHARTHDSIVLP